MKKKSTTFLIVSCAAFAWTAIMAGLCIWSIKNEKAQTAKLAQYQARAFFQEIVTTRAWNSTHGGVYVPVTSRTKPNPYLDDPRRDVTTLSGLKLTKINPAFMTRQIAEIAEKNNMIWFHITSANPIRPANAPEPWELRALESFISGTDEMWGFFENEEGRSSFRYMAPLWVETSCLKCHGEQGYKEGDLRGGISVTILADSLLQVQREAIRNSAFAYMGIWAVGLLGIATAHRRLGREASMRMAAISELEKSLKKVKTLSGLLPICSICKKIRDDHGYWNQIETYIQRHSDAEFSHSLCRECAEKHYPGFDIFDDEIEND